MPRRYLSPAPKPPDLLSIFTEVPLPNNPLTWQSSDYKVFLAFGPSWWEGIAAERAGRGQAGAWGSSLGAGDPAGGETAGGGALGLRQERGAKAFCLVTAQVPSARACCLCVSHLQRPCPRAQTPPGPRNPFPSVPRTPAPCSSEPVPQKLAPRLRGGQRRLPGIIHQRSGWPRLGRSREDGDQFNKNIP